MRYKPLKFIDEWDREHIFKTEEDAYEYLSRNGYLIGVLNDEIPDFLDKYLAN